MIHLKIFCPYHIFVIGELDPLNLVCLLIQTSTSACMMHSPKRDVLTVSHMTSFKFWEISDNISEMVQDRDSCNGRLI